MLLTVSDRQEARFCRICTRCNAHQFRVGHLFDTRHAVVNFGGPVHAHVGVDQLGNFSSFARSDGTI